MTKEDKIIAVVCVVILIASLAFFSILKDDGGTEAEVTEAGDVLGATRAFLASGKNTMITAEALHANLDDGFQGNDPYILSIRGTADYEAGHIPGAVNIGFRSVFTEENMSKLPKNKEIVVVCYTGHTASQITALLNMNGYNALCLKWGMSSWSSDPTVNAGKYYIPPTTDYPSVSGSEPGSWTRGRTRCGGDEPAPAAETADNGDSGPVDLRAEIHNYLSLGNPPAMKAADLSANLDDGDSSNDHFILSIRSASQYEVGHIPGAVNIGFKTLFTDENLSKLPKDKKIVVVCYTGHTASQATALLGVNGYDAAPLKFGMTGWSSNSTVAPSAYVKATAAHNFPVVKGEEPGDMSTGVIADTSEVIHTATTDFLGAGKNTMITAEALYNNLNDNYAGNDPYVLSIRSPEQYEIGHIPGAVNIPFRSVFTEENISQLPTGKDIVVVCYTGHTASQVTAMLNVLGYNALCLKFGMASWSFNSSVAPHFYDPSTVTDYPVVTGPEPGTFRTRQCGDDDDDDEGDVEDFTTGSVFDIARVACNNYLLLGKPAAMKASALYATLNDGNTTNDPYLLSIRSSSQYEKGHIAGSVNMGFSSMFDEGNLASLPTDKQIVVICYTGHTASQATALLNINGFDAVPLKFGMTGWTTNATIAPSKYDRPTACHNYPVVVGEVPGVLADGILAATDKVILDATTSFLAAGKSTFITAEALYNNLNDNYGGNDPYVLSIRKAADYEAGHIPGSVNIGFRSVFTEENISKLPTGKDIVVVCYTGHTASQVTAMLNVMGYEAMCLKFGMCSWSTSSDVTAGKCYDPSTIPDYPVVIGPEPGTFVRTRQGCGDGGDTGGSDTEALSGTTSDIVRAASNNYLAMGKPAAMKATDLYDLLNDDNATNDPFVLSIRSGAQYEIGHIGGAVNIGMSALFDDDNVDNLPTDRQIVVVCYTGHTASQATALLNINGYDAVALKFGMTGWTTNTTVAPSAFNKVTHAGNYPVCIGTEAGDMAGGVIADTVSIVREATNSFLGSGKGTMLTAEALYANLGDGYTGNDPYILSIRGSSDYNAGHIPGAVNIPFRSVFTEENISILPTNKQIVVVCYTGHTASQVTAMLNVLGFDAVCLKFGMCSWTTNDTVTGGHCYDPAKITKYPVVTGSDPGDLANSVGTRQGCGDPGEGGATEALTGSVFEITRAACNNYLGEGKPAAKKSSDVFALLNDTDTTNDPFILSIRSSSQYEIGHIPGAVNIPMSDLFTEESKSELPDDDTLIVVVCYTGHTASQAAALLNINGYNATALKFGMTGWTTNASVAPSAFNKGTSAHNYPVIIGSEAGVMGDAVLVAPTDEEIILEASRAYLEGGAKFIKADSLHANLDDGDAGNDPFVLSIRSGADYALGHIPGAVNIPWRSLFSVENLSLLPGDETQVVVVCYTGQTASQITALLNVLGFNASTLKHGMCSWTTNGTIAPKCFNNTTHQESYPTEAGTRNNGCGGDGVGSGGTFEGSADEWEILRQSCERYVNEVETMYITAEALYANLNDNFEDNDPYVISIRSSADYAVGHIPDAVNLAMGEALSEDVLETLPTNRQIVVYCYTGHGSCHLAAMLNINGFDVVSLKWGMCSWTDNVTVNAGKCYDPATAGHNYKVSVGSEPGAWGEGIIPN